MLKMTPRKRILAVIKGEMPDRIPFVQYQDIAAPNAEIWNLIGAENMGTLRWTRLHRIEYPDCRRTATDIEKEGIPGSRTFLETPRGILTEERYFEPNFGAASIKKHFISEPEDYDIFLSYLGNGQVVEDMEPYERACAELGDQGLPLVALERTPYQQLWVQWVNIQDLSWHLVDHPDRVEPVLAALADQERRIMEIVAASPTPFADFPDNITAPVVGERYFRKYCVPLYDELAGMMGDRPVYVHMDGDLKALWPAIDSSGVGGIDSLSPPPDNDTAAGDVVSMWPEMRLWVNFPSSVHLQPPAAVYDKAMEILEQAGHTGRLQIQVSENVPPGSWKQCYPQIVRAIEEFGQP